MAVDKEVDPVLIAFVKQNRLHFSTNTFKDILSTVGALPVAVVAISHQSEEHKDEVFNVCLDYLETLETNRSGNKRRVWKSKSSGDAKGIYICPEPIFMRKSCQEVAVILMEVKGNFDPKTATREDLMILALSCVLSSTLVFSIEQNFTNEMQEFLQMFGKYGNGGVGPEMKDSNLNLVLMINNWSVDRYPFGYHDCGTCPVTVTVTGKKMYNFRNERLDTVLHPDKELEEEVATKNQFFVDNFQKVMFSLMPGKDSTMADEFAVVPEFREMWHKTVMRLIHPSHLSIKCLGRHKLTGNHLVRLFEEISALMAETDPQEVSEQQFKDGVNKLTKDMNNEVLTKKLSAKQSAYYNQLSHLIGFSLEGVTDAVRSVIWH